MAGIFSCFRKSVSKAFKSFVICAVFEIRPTKRFKNILIITKKTLRKKCLAKWSGRLDLNQRPHGPEPCALPAALRPVYDCILIKMVGEPRIELGTSRTPSERYTTKPLPDNYIFVRFWVL